MAVTVKFHKRAWWIFINHRGRRRAKKVGDHETALQVARKIRERLTKGDLGLLAPEPGPTLRSFATAWLEAGEASRKASTHRFYAFNLRLHILPSLTRANCRDLITACRAKGLKPASMRGVNRTLSAVLTEAVDDHLLPANPAFRMGKHLRAGDELPPEIQPFTREEAHLFLEKAAGAFPEYAPFFLCALRTGMRLGELVALRWGDVDFSNRCIHVRRSWVAGRMTSTKNKRRRRIDRIDMSLQLSNTLRRLRTARPQGRAASGRAGVSDRAGKARRR